MDSLRKLGRDSPSSMDSLEQAPCGVLSSGSRSQPSTSSRAPLRLQFVGNVRTPDHKPLRQESGLMVVTLNDNSKNSSEVCGIDTPRDRLRSFIAQRTIPLFGISSTLRRFSPISSACAMTSHSIRIMMGLEEWTPHRGTRDFTNTLPISRNLRSGEFLQLSHEHM